jgi:hypothetical protein
MGEYAELAMEAEFDEWLDAGMPVAPRRHRLPLPDNPKTEWVGADGMTYEIKDMEHTHLINTIHLLERKGKAIETSKMILVSHPSYPYLVREAIRRNLLDNPHNGIDIRDPESVKQQSRSPVKSLLIPKTSRKIDFDL